MRAEDQRGLDGWLIGELRNHGRPRRLGKLLLDGGDSAEASELDERVETAERELHELRGRLQRVERRVVRRNPHHAAAHTRFLPNGSGYEIMELPGPPPRAGESVVVAGRGYRVLRVGRSPFPADRRPCVFLVGA